MSRLGTLEKRRADARKANTFGPLTVFRACLLDTDIIDAPSGMTTRVCMARAFYKLKEIKDLCLD